MTKGEDWLTEHIRKSLDKPPETPFDAMLTEMFRENLQKYEARAKGGAEPETGDCLSQDAGIQAALKSLRTGDPISLQDDAEAVLGEAAEELGEELLNDLDRLVRLTKAKGGVILSESKDEDLWTGILKSQLRTKLEHKAQKAGVDAAEYREWLQQGDEALRARTEDVNREGERTFAEDFGNP